MKALLRDSEVEAGRRRVVIIVHAAGRNMVRSLTQGKGICQYSIFRTPISQAYTLFGHQEEKVQYK